MTPITGFKILPHGTTFRNCTFYPSFLLDFGKTCASNTVLQEREAYHSTTTYIGVTLKI